MVVNYATGGGSATGGISLPARRRRLHLGERHRHLRGRREGEDVDNRPDLHRHGATRATSGSRRRSPRRHRTSRSTIRVLRPRSTTITRRRTTSDDRSRRTRTRRTRTRRTRTRRTTRRAGATTTTRSALRHLTRPRGLPVTAGPFFLRLPVLSGAVVRAAHAVAARAAEREAAPRRAARRAPTR